MSNDTAAGPSGPTLAESILEQCADGVLAFDRELRYTAWNAAMERLSGVARGDVLGRRAVDVFPFLVETGEDRCFHAALRGETVTSVDRPFEVPVTGRSGYFEGRYAPLRDGDGAVVGGMAVVRDVTERRREAEARVSASEAERERAEAALRVSEARFRAVFEQSPISTQIYAPDGRPLAANPAWEELFGVTLADIPEYNVLQDPQLVERDIMRFVERGFAGEAVDVPPILYDPNETIPDRTRHEDPRRWVGAVIYPIRGEDGGVREVVVMHEDLTEQKRAEDALRESERRFRSVVESDMIGVGFWHTSGDVTGANDALLGIVGYSRAELEGGAFRWRDLTPPEYADFDRQALRQILAEGVCTPFEKEYVRKDGRRAPVLVGGARFSDRDDSGPFFVVDIADRKHMEAALVASEQRLSLALEAARMGTWEWDVKTGELRWSESLEPIHGFKPGTFPGTLEAFQRCVHPDDRGWVGEAIARAVETGGDYSIEFRIVWPDGTLHWVAGFGKAFRDERGEPDRMIGFGLDITERKQADDLRAQLLAREQAAREQAEEASRLKDEFLAMVSHELRTPLNSMLGWTRLLRGGGLDDASAERGLEVIERNVVAQKQLIEDLLDVSRIVTGRLKLEVRPVELAAVIQSAVDSVRLAAEAKAIALEVAIDGAVGAVLGDGERLQQVVWNLASNAIKFTPRGGRVKLRLARDGDSAAIDVSDTGQGIKPEFMPHVFDRFRQGDASITRRYGGLGLGLSIVKHLVEMHGGSVRAESEGEGRGATFHVRIPLMKSAPPRAPRRAEEAGALPSLADARILVVDDEEDARVLLAALLERQGAEVRAAGSAAEALEILDGEGAWPADVLVSDIGMPGRDGYALIEEVRRRGPGRNGDIPAVALTAYARAEDRVRALAAGYQMHVTKPVEPAELVMLLANLIGLAGRG